MFKSFFLLFIFFLLTSCFIHKGKYYDGICRPKNENFKLSKVNHKLTDKLVFNRVYISNNVTKANGYVFLSDGRMISLHSKDGFELKLEDVVDKNWRNAPSIGYWRTNNNKILIEYFVCSNSGYYIKKNGEFKNDTIIFDKDCGTSNPFKSVKCPEIYTVSNFSIE
jgi:hypothetical protein